MRPTFEFDHLLFAGCCFFTLLLCYPPLFTLPFVQELIISYFGHLLINNITYTRDSFVVLLSGSQRRLALK
jgi:hypothetical protein